MENPSNNPEYNSENNSEQIENIEKISKKDTDKLTSFQRKFIRKKIKNYGISFLDSFENPDSVYRDFQDFLALGDNSKDFALSINWESDNIKQKILSGLKAEALREVMPLENNYKAVLSSYKKDYNLSPEKEENLKNLLKSLDYETLKDLSFSQNKREEFLIKHKIFKDRKEARENMNIDTGKKTDEILKDLGINIKKLSDDEKKVLLNIIEIALGESFGKIDYNDLANIFAKIDEKSKLALIKVFVKNLSYKELIDLGIFDERKIKEKLKREIEAFYEENFGDTDLSEDEKNLILEKINLDSIVVNIEDEFDDRELLENFFNKDNSYSTIDGNFTYLKGSLKEKIAKKIAGELNSYVSLAKEEMYSDPEHLYSKMDLKSCDGGTCALDDKPKDFHKNFINFISSPESGISKDIREAVSSKFYDNNYIILENKETGKKTYYKISQVDFGDTLSNKKIILKDITATGGVYREGENIDGAGNYITLPYDDFYNTLKVLSDENSKEKIEFLSENEFKNSGVKEVDPDSEISSGESLMEKISMELLGKSSSETNNLTKNIKNLALIYKEDGDNGDIPFEILTYDDHSRKIKFKSGNKIDEISYNDLYEGISKKAKKWDLVEKIKDGDDLLRKAGSKYDDLKVGKDAFVKKDDKNSTFNILRNSSTGYGIQIEKLDDGSIEYLFGKFNAKGELKDVKYKTNSFDKLLLDIKKYELKPELNIEEKIKKQNREMQEEEEKEGLEAKHSTLQSILGRMSIVEIGMGLKKIPEILKTRLEQGNQLASAKLAVRLGKMLGDGVYYDLKAQFASEENKIIEELASSRKKLGTNEMLDLIEKRVLRVSNAPRYEVEAAMTVLLEKYGSLYPKRFHKYRGSYLWYKRFGGKVGDAKFNEVQKRCIESTAIATGVEQPIPFTEEVLLEDHLKALDKNFPFRVRPRADKAFGKAKKTGIAESMETGEKKASDMPTAAERINYAFSLLPGEEAEYLGAMPKVFEKYGSAAEMHALPFVLTASGIAKDFDPSLIGKLKSLAYTTSYAELALNSTEAGIKKYQNFVVEATKFKLGEEKAKQLQEIFSYDKEKRVKKLRDFWDEYGTELIETLLGNDGFIFVEAQKGNKAFNEYINHFDAVVNDSTYGPKEENVQNEYPQSAGLYTYVNGLLSKLSLTPNDYTSSQVFNSYIKSLENIRYLVDENGNPVDESIKKAIFKKTYKGFENKVMSIVKPRLSKLGVPTQGYKIPKEAYKESSEIAELAKHGLDVFGGLESERKNDAIYDQFLEEAWKKFSSGKNLLWEDEEEEVTLPDILNLTPMQVEAINNTSYNRDEKKVA